MPSFKKLPGGVLIAFLFISIFEFANAYFDAYFYSPHVQGIATPFEGLRMKIKNELSQSRENKFDIIILGDSHSHVSIIPRIIEEKTGRSCFNFSTFGRQGVMGSYWMFRNYIEAHDIKPKYIIVGFSPFYTYPITKSFWDSSNILTDLSDIRKGNVRAFIEEFGVVQGIKFLLPSLKHQGRFKEFIRNPFSFEMPDRVQLNKFTEQFYLDKGYYPERINESYPKESRESGYDKFFQYTDLNKFVISEFSYKYLRKMLDLAKEHKIKVIYHIPPIAPYLYSVVKNYSYMDRYNEFVDSLKKDYPDLIAVNSQHLFNENDMFLDIYHLNGKGAPILSGFLAQRINELQRGN
ncbi:MAG: DUF1574 family protein [Nitrospirae bacterium]|nr:DUF1574 family protein [Nitrospirota bacterium]